MNTLPCVYHVILVSASTLLKALKKRTFAKMFLVVSLSLLVHELLFSVHETLSRLDRRRLLPRHATQSRAHAHELKQAVYPVCYSNVREPDLFYKDKNANEQEMCVRELYDNVRMPVRGETASPRDESACAVWLHCATTDYI